MQPLTTGDDEMRSIEALLEDAEFQRLERSLSEPILFDILGMTFNEGIHSRMLRWLLDPSESHGLGTTFLRRFLYAAAKASVQNDYGVNGHPITPLEAESYSFADVSVDAESELPNHRRLDLVVRSEREKWLCVIENKVLAAEGDEQTISYYEESLGGFQVSKFPSRLFVYLSPNGVRPSSRHFVPMAYFALARLLRKCSDLGSNFGRIAIDQYVRCLEGRIVELMPRFQLCWVNRLRPSEHRPVLLNQRGGSFSLLNEQNISLLPLARPSESGSRFEGRRLGCPCRETVRR
jgi:hypothetical protein